MANRSLELTIISAKDLNNLNLIAKMDVYAVAYIDGAVNQDQKQKTPVDKDGDSNPTWNHPMKFTIDDSAALQNRLTLVVKIKAVAMFGDKDLGQVYVPVKELLEGASTKTLQFVTYQVRKPSGKPKGELTFSYKFGEKIAEFNEEPVTAYPAEIPNKADKLDEPVTAYPAVESGFGSLFPQPYPPPVGATPGVYPPPAAVIAGGDTYPPPATVAADGDIYPPPTAAAGGHYSYPPAGSAYYPPPAGYAGYAYQQQPAYGGYPPLPTPGYAYPPVQQAQQGQKKNKFGVGLGAGLLGGALGGLLIGDMVSDVADGGGWGDF